MSEFINQVMDEYWIHKKELSYLVYFEYYNNKKGTQIVWFKF